MCATEDCGKVHRHKIVLSCKPFGETDCLFGGLAGQDQVESFWETQNKKSKCSTGSNLHHFILQAIKETQSISFTR